MGNEITISKTNLLLAGLFLAIVLGGYVAFGYGARGVIPGPGAPAADAAQGGASNGNAAAGQAGSPAGSAQGVQDVYIKALGTGAYDNPQVTVKRGVPVRLHFSTDGNAGCGSALYLDAFGVRLVSRSGEEEVAEFTPQQDGTYAYHCGMNMFRGKMIVTG